MTHQLPHPPGPRIRFPWLHFKKRPMELPDFLLSAARQYGDIVYFKIGPRQFYLLNHPDFIQEVLISQQSSFTKGSGLQHTRQLLGEGVLASEGNTHLQQRRMIQALFRPQQMAAFGEMTIKAAESISATWHRRQTINLPEEMTTLTMAIIGKIFFGLDIDNQSPQISADLITILADFNRMISPTNTLLRTLSSTTAHRTIAAKQRIETFIAKIINTHPLRNESRPSFISILLEARTPAGQAMTQEQIQAETIALFLTGFEATSSTLTWLFYLLSQNFSADACIADEIKAILSGRAPAVSDIDALVYTRMTFNEALRLYPPAWIIGQEATQDVQIGGFTIPAGATVLVSQWVMHHDSRYYPDPYRFDPTRWEAKAQVLRPKMAYFPFGGGPRLCIGEPLVQMIAILTTATLMQSWQLQLLHHQNIQPQFTMTMRPPNELLMRPEVRKL